MTGICCVAGMKFLRCIIVIISGIIWDSPRAAPARMQTNGMLVRRCRCIVVKLCIAAAGATGGGARAEAVGGGGGTGLKDVGYLGWLVVCFHHYLEGC